MIDRHDIYQHELIGRRVRVAEATDPGLAGLTGTVVDETKNTLVVSNGQKRVRIPKGPKIEVLLGEKTVCLDTSRMRFRPEDRVKKLAKLKA